MGGTVWSNGARAALWAVLAAGYGLMLYWNLPGHLSVDSVLALREGRFGVRDTWNPALFGWLLGLFDRIVRGTALYVVAAGLLLTAAWGALALLRPRANWLAPVLAAGLVLAPQLLIYQAIVWKDVLFANCAVAGFVALAFAVRGPDRRWGWLALSALMLAAAGLLRQNGPVLVLPAALALAWTGRGLGWRRNFGGAALWTVGVVGLTVLLSAVAQPQGIGAPDGAGARGLRLLQTYDVVAAAAREPDRPLDQVAAVNPRSDAYIRSRAADVYSPERVDTLNKDPQLNYVLLKLKRHTIRNEWLDLVTERPDLYLAARLDAFRWVLATPTIDRCLPVWVGVQGPADALRDLGMGIRQAPRDVRLFNYATWFMDTPALSHLTYGALAVVVGLVLLVRREPQDVAMLALLAGALVFAATFFVISIACDYRYLYFLDLAAMTGALYLAIDPRLRRRGA